MSVYERVKNAVRDVDDVVSSDVFNLLMAIILDIFFIAMALTGEFTLAILLCLMAFRYDMRVRL